MLCRRPCCLDVAVASLPTLPPGPVSQVRAYTVATVLALLLYLLTLLPRQVRSATVLSQPLLPYCRILYNKSIFLPLLLLSLLPSCCFAASLPSLTRKHLFYCRYCYLDVTVSSLPPLPQGPVSQVSASTVAAVLPLLFLLLTLPTSQFHSATVLSQILLLSCRSLWHKKRFFAAAMLGHHVVTAVAAVLP